MKECEVYKQGIELEGFVFDTERRVAVNQDAVNAFKNIHPTFYYDDRKTEFPSKPYTHLGDLSQHVKEVMTQALIECERRKWDYILAGCYPFTIENPFASGHVHISLKKDGCILDSSALRHERKRLFNAQPLIAMLSQNSPVYSGKNMNKDVRLSMSSWSQFTEFDSDEDGHYLALALNKPKNIATIEVRIPSAAPLHQIIGVAGIIRAIVEIESNAVELEYTPIVWKRVMNYGAQAIVPVRIPTGLNYNGTKYDTIHIRLCDLFKFFLREYKDDIDNVFSTVETPTRRNIYAFFDSITRGLTLSDYVSNFWNKVDDKSLLHNKLVEMTKLSYVDNKGFWEVFDEPKDILCPEINRKITFEELLEIANNYKVRIPLEGVPEALISITKKLKSDSIFKLIDYLKAIRTVGTLPVTGTIPDYLETAISTNVLIHDNGKLSKGDNYLSVVQLLDDYMV